MTADRAHEVDAAGQVRARRRRLLKRAVEWTFYALLLVFLVLYLRSTDLDELRGVRVAWWAVGVATVLALAFRYWGAVIWTTLLRSLGARDVRLTRELVDVYARSWLGRYIPGTAPWILGKIWFASQHGISRRTLAVSSLLEAALQIIVQMLFALVLLTIDPRFAVLPAGVRPLFVVGAVLCLVALVPSVFNTVVSLAFRVLRRGPLEAEQRVGWRSIGVGGGMYAVGSVIGGMSLFFVARAVHAELGWSEALFVIGVSTLAGAVSMLAIFAPGGIGVREGIQVLLLSVIMPTEIALLVAVAMRLHGVVVDVAFFALGRVALLGRRGGPATPVTGPPA